MNVIPAVDILDGKAVQLRGGDPNDRIFESDDPIEEAKRWCQQGADRVHIVDLDRALDKGDNLDLIDTLLDACPVPCNVGGGLRGARPIRTLLEDHPDAMAVVATRAWQDPQWLEHITDEFPGRIIVALELKQGTIAVKGWTERTKLTLEEGLFRLENQDLGGVLFTDVDREGKLIGPNTDTAQHAAAALDVPLIVAGGISTVEHIHELRDAGAWGCVVGTALYTGDLDFQDALKAAQEASA